MAAAAQLHAEPRMASVVGPPGLAREVFSQLLTMNNVVVADRDEGDAPDPSVVVLVEPLAEHWAEARATSIPIVLVLGEPASDVEVVDAILAGADAVLDGDTPESTVMDVLEEVIRGGSVLAPAHTRVVAGLARAAAAQPGVALSRREGEILASIADGHSVKQTAIALGISAKTVENLQGRLFRKLGVRNRAQAVARSHTLGLL